jgi:hypothetical protein
MEDDVLELSVITSKRNSGRGRAHPSARHARWRGWGVSGMGQSPGDAVMEWWCAVEKVYVGANGGTAQRAVEQRRGRCPAELRPAAAGGRER